MHDTFLKLNYRHSKLLARFQSKFNGTLKLYLKTLFRLQYVPGLIRMTKAHVRFKFDRNETGNGW